MKPTRIELENFTSYAKEIVDLSGVTLAALVGENGAGKSSLVDGILWCFFGNASKGRGDDPYLRKVGGAHVYPMRVAVHFELGGELYQVVRQRTKSKALLDLYVCQDHASTIGGMGHHWVGLSDKGKGDTQAEIVKLLRLEYDTLTSSALMLQGQSDTFTRSSTTDGDRMKVLQSILGLDRYGKLLEAAKAKAARYLTKAENWLELATGLRQRADQVPVIEAERAAKQVAAGEVARRLGAAEKQVHGLEAQLAQRPALQQQMRDQKDVEVRAEQAHDKAVTDHHRLALEIQRAESDITAPDRLRGYLPPAEAALAQAVEVKQRLGSEVDKLVADVAVKGISPAQLEAARQEVAKRIAERPSRAQRMGDMHMHLRAAEDLMRQAPGIREAAEGFGVAQQAVAKWVAKAKAFGTAQAIWAEHRAKYREWRAEHDGQVATAKTAFEAAASAARLLEQVPCSGMDIQPRCQLLQDAVGKADRAAELHKAYQGLLTTENPHLQPGEQSKAAMEAVGYDEVAHQEAESTVARLKALAEKLPALEAAEQRVRELTTDIERLGVEDKEDALRIQHLERVEIPAMERQAVEHQEAQQRLALARKALQQAEADEVAARDEVTKLRADLATADQAALEAKGRLVVDLRPRLVEAKQAMVTAETEKAQALERMGDVGRQLSLLLDVPNQLAQAQQTEAAERRNLQEINTALGGLHVRLEEAQRAGEEAKALEVQAREATEQARVYQVLVEAYGGKRGVASVQKLIVEGAVPQIERLATGFLGRLAGGRLQVRLDTQVAGKTTGGDIDVLRITVLEQGTDRDYRTFSGAEKFMVDMGLRVALARFLAHRAGAEINLFVVDEGLGALDKANREEVMAAIQETASEFGMVLVITHIPELQDRLPQRITVRRGDDAKGSTVEVVA